jgi:hypothetical protein
MFYEFETFMTYKVSNIIHITCNKIIHADNKMSFFEKSVAEMAAEETGASGNECVHHCCGLS